MTGSNPDISIALPTYKARNFNDVKLHEMYGPKISKREQRKFDKYANSLVGRLDAFKFNKDEQLKADAARDYADHINTAQLKQTLPNPISTQKLSEALTRKIPTQTLTKKPINTAYWNAQANKYGFNNMEEVKAWQQQNGLVADGMFGKKSLARWNELQQPSKVISRQINNAFDESPIDVVLKSQRTFYKQGGTMNKINYFQQGGAAPQQDIKAQVTALVQAAMQGDQKATQQVNQIMEAAKAGDQQAMQIAQIMEQVIKELQGQATAAKWGAKLGYIKSLKYAKGGKTCPTCKEGGIPETADKASIKSTKKVEEKACGGKTKKKYFGGLI